MNENKLLTKTFSLIIGKGGNSNDALDKDTMPTVIWPLKYKN